ncbi:hypothetical protein [Sphingobacterium humi]|uniref:Lipocalin-like domain-containing protein n=1 Tax=Sphingobacterium humi TaxID=1796905 RepID=A0A6N8KWP7_9SPHI|nr:hypothetical protein [Sphingobacterium humi]MVZ61159.1 hypothetical protein [Sphingobacterium humi]
MKYLFAPLLCSILFACGASNSSTKKPKIEGNWRWIKSTGGFVGRTTTPESSNQEVHLQISKDSIFTYENGEFKGAVPYNLQLGKVIESQKMEWQFEFEGRRTAVYQQDSLLILKEQCYDCFNRTFVKMKE